jgi:hypothetical protein
MSDADRRWQRPWLRTNRVLRVMLHTRWSAETWSQIRVESDGRSRCGLPSAIMEDQEG